MTTTTLFSRPAVQLYRNLLRRNLGITLFYAALSFFFFPLQYILQMVTSKPEDLKDLFLGGSGHAFTAVAAFFYTAMMLFFPIILSAVLLGYLTSRSATDTFHALPLRRSTLLLTHLAAGMTILALPMIACFGVVMVTGFFYRPYIDYHAGAMLFELLVWLVIAFSSLVIATLIGVFVGTGFDHVVLSLGINGVLPGVICFTSAVCESSILGYVSKLGYWVFALSPISYLVSRFMVVESENTQDIALFNWAVLAWALVSVLLVWLAVQVYTRRKSELAGTTGRSNPPSVIIKLAATYICGGLMGFIFEGVFHPSNFIFILGCLIGTCSTFVLFEAVIARGFSTFKRNLPLLGGCAVFMLAFSAFYITSGFGVENLIPAPSMVSSVTLPNMGRYNNLIQTPAGYDWEEDSYSWKLNQGTVTLTSPEGKELVEQIHRESLQQQKRAEEEPGGDDDSVYQRFFIEYRVLGVFSLQREYYCTNRQGLALMGQLLDLPEYRQQTHPVFSLTPQQVASVTLSTPLFTGQQTLALTEEQTGRLMEAARSDLLAEPFASLQQQDVQAACILEFNPKPRTKGMGYDACYLMVLPGFTGTLQTLAELGYPAEAFAPGSEGLTLHLFDRYLTNNNGYAYKSVYGAFVGPHRKKEEDTYYLTRWQSYETPLLSVSDPEFIGRLLPACYNTARPSYAEMAVAGQWELEPEYTVFFSQAGQTRKIPLRLVTTQLAEEDQQRLLQLLVEAGQVSWPQGR